jgi:hypothetical protein
MASDRHVRDVAPGWHASDADLSGRYPPSTSIRGGRRTWDIAVLTGVRLEHSAVWRHRTFGNEVLANPAVDDTGVHRGLAAHATPHLPSDAILCETIRRFKGLERAVVVLVELRPDDERLDQHLYVGASRARQHLVVIAPAAVLERVR